jgi:signal transduction histidine kinase
MSQWSWRAYACLAGGLAALYFVVPSVAAQDIVYLGVGASAVIAIVTGVTINRPRARAPWYLLAAGQACFVLGDLLWDVFADVLHSIPFPSVADVLYLAGYPLLASGLALLVRDREPHGDHANLIDALIVSAGLAIVTWVFWIDRYTGDRTLSRPAIVISIAYPIMDLLLIGFLARLTLAPGPRSISYRLLSASLFLTLGADVAFAGLEFAGAYNGRNLIDIGWLLSYVAIGAAALHPTMGAMAKAASRPVASSKSWRLALLGVASLVVPGVFAVQSLGAEPINAAALGVGSGAIFLLVLVRMAGLLRQVELDAQQLRRQGDIQARALAREHQVVGELQRLNRLKGDFVTMVSHELRSPLTAIIGYAKTLRLPHVSEDAMLRAEALQILERQGERLLRMVENLLTASQLENRAIPFSVSPVSVEHLFREVTQNHSAAGERISVSLPVDQVIINTDRQLLGRVLSNLLDNALKYSASGSPCELGARCTDRGVELWVKDHGIGIEPEEVGRIFDRFYQVDSSRTLSNTGVGLGLTLVRDILRELGGSIEVTSEPGRGSTFLVTVPLRFAGASEEESGDRSLLSAS